MTIKLTIALQFPDSAAPSKEHLARWADWAMSFPTFPQLIAYHGDSAAPVREYEADRRWEFREVPTSQRGLIQTLQDAEGEVLLAADGCELYDFAEVLELVQQIIGGDDVVFGTRYHTDSNQEAPNHDKWLAYLLGLFFGSPLRDINTSIVAIRRSAMNQMDLQCTGIESMMELAIKSQLYGLRTGCRNVQLLQHETESKQSDGIQSWWQKLRFIMLYSPRWLLLLPGLAMLIFGMIGYGLVLLNLTLFGIQFDAHTLIVASVIAIMGYQSVLFAVVSKTFGVTSGLMPPDPRLTRLFAFANLERGLLIGVGFIFTGTALMSVGLIQWLNADLGPLNYSKTMRWVVPGMTTIAIGFQTILWGVFASFLGVSRRDAKSLSMVDFVHDSVVHNRRVRVLSRHLARALPHGARVLDVGAGDGLMSAMIMEQRPDVTIEGIDIQVRDKTHIPVSTFDGISIPFADNAFDVVMFVDVLHHTNDPEVLLRDATRVARDAVILKDHTRNGLLAGTTLRFMDRVGNLRHDVPLPYNYWPRSRWEKTFERLGLQVDQWVTKLHIYPRPADWLFGRSLHFVARLRTSKNT